MYSSSGHPIMCFCSSEQIWTNKKLQCIRKVFTVLHILLCYSLIAKWIKFNIFLKILQTYPILTTWKKFVWNLCNLKTKNEKNRVHKYLQPLLDTLLKHPWHQLQPQIFLGMMRQALIIIIWDDLPFFSLPLHLSSSVSLDRGRCTFSAIFDWVQSQAVAGPLKGCL